jgi:hypothetical protein
VKILCFTETSFELIVDQQPGLPASMITLLDPSVPLDHNDFDLTAFDTIVLGAQSDIAFSG